MAKTLPRHSGPLTLAEHNELGEARESWCPIEMCNEQSNLRTKRKHYDHAYHSFQFGEGTTIYERLVWPKNEEKHAERRHFPPVHNYSLLKI